MTLHPSARIHSGAVANRRYVDGDSLDFSHPLVWSADGVLSSEECEALILRIEAAGCVPAPVTTSRGFQMRPDIRNNTRAILEDLPLAAVLFARVREFVPVEMNDGHRAVGANERFRCYRYDPGQRFAPHFDGAFARSDHERSLLTFMIYLNEGFAGGTTRFNDFEIEVAPKPGRALFFQHRLLHEGAVVTSGTKYVARSDIMYAMPSSVA